MPRYPLLPWEVDLEKLRKEQRRVPVFEPIPLYLPLEHPPLEKKPEPDTDDTEKRGIWELDLV